MVEAKRLKVKNGMKGFIPQSINFSELKRDSRKYDKENEFDYGDDGLCIEKQEESIDYEKLILQMLCNLDAQEKLIFMYQLFRDNGYQIDHGSFARTLNISRMKYMKMLKMVKIKTILMVEGKSLLKNAQMIMK